SITTQHALLQRIGQVKAARTRRQRGQGSSRSERGREDRGFEGEGRYQGREGERRRRGCGPSEKGKEGRPPPATAPWRQDSVASVPRHYAEGVPAVQGVE